MDQVAESMLHPGEYAVACAGERIGTLLGSCVAVTLWHPGRRMGAMCHYVLPTRGRPVGGTPDGRYGDEAMHLMVRGLEARQVNVVQCEAKVFGGGCLLAAPPHVDVGRMNAEAAHAMLRRYDIPVVAESLFGSVHRRIRFDVSSGEVWMWKGQPSAEAGEQGACA